MPAIMGFNHNGEGWNVWNLTEKVGTGGASRGMEVKFCQYLMYIIDKAFSQKPRILLEDVIGVWGPRSRAWLANMENKNEVLRDGCIDPLRPGQIVGSISQMVYKFFLMQQGYVEFKTGKNMGEVLRAEGALRVQEILLGLPDDNLDIPADLKAELIRVREIIEL